ncbi:MAG: heme o synthase [Exiguobacterium sp.]|uniref:heme o synthase n=1 Tax=Exiguobacterium TaxID=33986 RepID=UPI0004A91EBE|nr:heme o synthase [Exiguobacterium sp. AB2]KDN58916.1 protoheme IX farnesyltransferase [Exiguobacterium sp. AB2]MDX5322478.1 heme o synthase [Exiguobacterium sp.]MDX5424203.1 heme o synthase [Exiguobacterium sp.]MDX6771722.1 heme o synthase [Exiguobacterium sp.]
MTKVNPGMTVEVEYTESASFRDYVALAKMGIVRANLLLVFAGFFVAATYQSDTPVLYLFEVWPQLLLTMLGSALVISGSCYLNNFVDRDIDYLMGRTDNRPSVTGKISGERILLLGLTQLAVGTFMLLIVSYVAAVFGLIGAFFYVVIYTMWLKRTHTLNTVVGSISGAVPPLIGWAAIDPALHIDAWLMFLVMFLWQPPHFLALAMRRVEEYRAAGIPMLPVVNGFAITKRQIIWWIATLIPASLLFMHYGTVYVIIAAVLGGYWLYLGLKGFKAEDEIKWANKMFFYSLIYLVVWIVALMLTALPSS